MLYYMFVVVGSVLVALTSPAEAAREAAVGVLLALKKALKTLEVECDFKWLLMKLVHCTEELVVDKTHLQQVKLQARIKRCLFPVTLP